jgi:predicted RNA binding protein YcfA (HicA-like mRNA interferase family)
MRTSNKELNLLIRKAKKQGWVVFQTRANHLRWEAPDGAYVTSSCSPSDNYAVKQITRDLQRHGFITTQKGK